MSKEKQEKSLLGIVDQVELQSKAEKYSHINFKPTESMANAAKRGLEIRSKQPESNRCCTSTGIARARQLINRENLSPSTVKRMLSFFQRHSAFKDKHKDKTSKAYQSWLLWGGDAGFSWAKKITKQLETADNKKGLDFSSNPNLQSKTRYGYCPECGAEGVERERRPNGYTTCKNGHKCKSNDYKV